MGIIGGLALLEILQLVWPWRDKEWDEIILWSGKIWNSSTGVVSTPTAGYSLSVCQSNRWNSNELYRYIDSWISCKQKHYSFLGGSLVFALTQKWFKVILSF